MAKIALVTGGARGIGRACALALADAGFDIALVDLLAAEKAATARDIEARGVRTLTVQADVSDFARAHAVAEQIVTHWGQLDVLLNNAGAPNPKPILEISEAEFDRTIAVNLKSCFNYVHACAPFMMKQETGGRIISISSINASPISNAERHSSNPFHVLKTGKHRSHELAPIFRISPASPAH